MNIKITLKRPSHGSGNPGMQTPYEQGFMSGANGDIYSNPYDQRGEEEAFADFQCGWKNGEAAGIAG
jgi:hypothetical protein